MSWRGRMHPKQEGLMASDRKALLVRCTLEETEAIRNAAKRESGMPETHLRYGLPLAATRRGSGGLALRNTKSSMETVYSSFPGV